MYYIVSSCNRLLTSMKVFTILFCGWLGGYAPVGGEKKTGRLLTIEEVGAIMKGNYYMLQTHY